MHLIELLLPTHDNAGDSKHEVVDAVQRELLEAFGGTTAFIRSPADGAWKNDGEQVTDEIVVVEVMVDFIDREWWRNYRSRLEESFGQEEVLIRAHPVERL